MRGKFFGTRFYFKDACLNHFYLNKWHIFFLSFLFFVGMLTGIITLSQLSKVFSIADISDIILLDAIKGKAGFAAFFFGRIFSFIIAAALIFCVCLNFFASFLAHIFIFYRGYLLGLNMAIFILIYGIGGVVNIIIFYVPFQIFFYFILLNFAAVNLNMCYQKRRFRFQNCCPNFLGFCLTFLTIIAIFAFIEGIIMPGLLRNIILNV